MRSKNYLRLVLILLPMVLSAVAPSPLTAIAFRPPAPQPLCSPYAAPLLVSYGYAHYPATHTIVLTAVFSPDDLLIERSFYTLNGRFWRTDIIPGDAACPAQIRAFLDYTLGTLNTGSPPFRYTQGHDLTAYTDFLRQAHRLCSETAMQHTGCQWQRLYLPLLRAGE